MIPARNGTGHPADRISSRWKVTALGPATPTPSLPMPMPGDRPRGCAVRSRRRSSSRSESLSRRNSRRHRRKPRRRTSSTNSRSGSVSLPPDHRRRVTPHRSGAATYPSRGSCSSYAVRGRGPRRWDEERSLSPHSSLRGRSSTSRHRHLRRRRGSRHSSSTQSYSGSSSYSSHRQSASAHRDSSLPLDRRPASRSGSSGSSSPPKTSRRYSRTRNVARVKAVVGGPDGGRHDVSRESVSGQTVLHEPPLPATVNSESRFGPSPRLKDEKELGSVVHAKCPRTPTPWNEIAEGNPFCTFHGRTPTNELIADWWPDRGCQVATSVPGPCPPGEVDNAGTSPEADSWWDSGCEHRVRRIWQSHFARGHCHQKPPWYLCSSVADNLEHPVFLHWLNTVPVLSIAEVLQSRPQAVKAKPPVSVPSSAISGDDVGAVDTMHLKAQLSGANDG